MCGVSIRRHVRLCKSPEIREDSTNRPRGQKHKGSTGDIDTWWLLSTVPNNALEDAVRKLPSSHSSSCRLLTREQEGGGGGGGGPWQSDTRAAAEASPRTGAEYRPEDCSGDLPF